MALTISTDVWDVDGLFESLWCPVCGGGDFEGRAISHAYCSSCNSRFTASRTANGDGYLVTVDSSTVFPDFAPPIPGNTVHGKFVGIDSPNFRWWSNPVFEGEPVKNWKAAKPR